MQNPLDQYRQTRIGKLLKIKKLGVNPYPAKVKRNQEISQARLKIGQAVSVAGRIMSWRGYGKLRFADLVDGSGKIQLVFKIDQLAQNQFDFLKLLDLGDFLAVQGEVFKTKTEEISILVVDFQILSKSLRPLPEKWHGLQDTEERYRKRYLDLLCNPQVRQRFKIRSQMVSLIRQYLDSQGFMEFETPTLQPLYGGANAKPFSTHVNSLDQEFYLRIADELYLKRLIIGGYEKLYEICKDFRNEGMDLSHQPEFTMIEYYQAYADYQDIMNLTESLIKFCAKKIFGKLSMKVEDREISLAGRWEQITMKAAVKKYLKIDYENINSQDLIKQLKSRSLVKGEHVELTGKEGKDELFFKLFDHFVPEYLIKPIWIIDYPAEVSPLSKAKASEPSWVERFEGYIGGKEICDGWTEINDPIDQRSRFESQKGKKEGHPIDEDFIEALEYGMPPLGGIGIGIDRLTMFFTNTWSIKEVVLFPLMKRKEK